MFSYLNDGICKIYTPNLEFLAAVFVQERELTGFNPSQEQGDQHRSKKEPKGSRARTKVSIFDV